MKKKQQGILQFGHLKISHSFHEITFQQQNLSRLRGIQHSEADHPNMQYNVQLTNGMNTLGILITVKQ